MKKGIYRGPPHYWHHYALNPRERYYYGYYGMYGPYVNPNFYEPINEEFRLSDGCHDNKALIDVFLGTTVGVGSMMLMLFLGLIIIFCLLKFLVRI